MEKIIIIDNTKYANLLVENNITISKINVAAAKDISTKNIVGRTYNSGLNTIDSSEHVIRLKYIMFNRNCISTLIEESGIKL